MRAPLNPHYFDYSPQDLIMFSGGEFGPPESLQDVTRAIETYIPKAQWIRLEGDDMKPVRSLACHLNTTWSNLQGMLGIVKSKRYALADRLGKPSVPLIRPDRSGTYSDGSTYFSIENHPLKRLSDALEVLASEEVTKSERNFNETGSNQHKYKKQRRSARLCTHPAQSVSSPSDPCSKTFQPPPPPSKDHSKRPAVIRVEPVVRSKDPAGYAKVGQEAATLITSLPKGRARGVALRHFYSGLPKQERERLEVMCRNDCSAMEAVKQKAGVELLDYMGILDAKNHERRKRRELEMPDRPPSDFNGIEAYAKKDGGLDTRPECERRSEFLETCPNTHDLLLGMLASPWKLDQVHTARVSILSGGSKIVSQGGKKNKVKKSLSGEELTQYVKAVMEPVERSLSLLRDVIVSRRSSGACLCDGSVERGLWLRSFGGTQLDHDLKVKQGLAISNKLDAANKLEISLAANFQVHC